MIYFVLHARLTFVISLTFLPFFLIMYSAKPLSSLHTVDLHGVFVVMLITLLYHLSQLCKKELIYMN